MFEISFDVNGFNSEVVKAAREAVAEAVKKALSGLPESQTGETLSVRIGWKGDEPTVVLRGPDDLVALAQERLQKM